MRQSSPCDDPGFKPVPLRAAPAASVTLGHEREARRSGRLEMALYGIYEISKLLCVPARLESSLSGVLALLSNFLATRNSLIALLDDEGDPQLIVGSGGSEASNREYFECLQKRAVGRMVTTRMPLVVENAAEDELFSDMEMSWWEPRERACVFIGVPIKDHDRVIGVFTITRDGQETQHFRYDEDVRFLSMVANLIGLTVRMHEMLARDRQLQIAEQARLAKSVGSEAPRPHAVPRQRMDDSVRSLGRIVGHSKPLRTVIDKVQIVAGSNSAILLRGESGTGKELFAQAIHDLSSRSRGPYVKLNCAALPESVLESELFGHEKGAFTGAVTQRKGRFELADGGTLFLDEIGEISPMFQAKLLRVLQEGEFERVGGTRTLRSDFRLVAATNRNLEEAVAKGEFRADLYYRISVVPLFLPPLRERPGDIPELAQSFLDHYNEEHGSHIVMSREAMSVMGSCYFPGNVRELENCVRRTATFAQKGVISEHDLACHQNSCLSSMLWRVGAAAMAHPAPKPPAVPLPVINHPGTTHHADDADDADMPMHGAATGPSEACSPDNCPMQGGTQTSERERLIEAMTTAGWVQAKAARLLNLTPRQMGYALRKYDIPIKKF